MNILIRIKEFTVSFYHKLSEKYIITILDSKTLHQVKTYEATLNKGLILGFISSFLLVLGTILIFVYTPLNSIFFPYKEAGSFKEKSIELNKKIKQLESDLDAYKEQVEKLKEIVTGNSSSGYLSTLSSKKKSVVKPTASFLLLSPLKGYTTEHFSSLHPSVDIASKRGQKIRAIYSGHVVYTGWAKDTGNTLIIQHPHNILSVYKHCESILVNATSKIQANQEIATVGSTGELSTGYHLHFELWSNGKALNPEKYIQFK